MYYCLLLLIVLGLSACSDDSSSSSKKDESPESSSSADSLEGSALPFVGGPVMFTEVDPINIVYEDHEGDDAGWVELFNTSADTVDLTGMYLTDSKSEPFKWKFGNVKLELPIMCCRMIRLTWLEVVAGPGPMRRTIRRDSVMRTRCRVRRRTVSRKTVYNVSEA